MTSSAPPLKVGDIWYRVDGLREEFLETQLEWEEWRCVKVTRCGGWFESTRWTYKKKRFAHSHGARWLRRTPAEALQGLIARKRRHIAIIDWQREIAEETLKLATHALKQLTRKAA